MWNVVKPRNIFHLKASSVFLSDTLHLEVWWIDKPSKNKNKRQSGSKQSKKKIMLNSLLMEKRNQTPTDIKVGLDFTQAPCNSTVWISNLISNVIHPSVPAVCAEGMPWNYKWKLQRWTTWSLQETKQNGLFSTNHIWGFADKWG